jgi:NTE family protein
MVKRYNFSFFFLVLFLFTFSYLNAQVQVGDTLDMSSNAGLHKDTTLAFQMADSVEVETGRSMKIGLVLSGGGAKGLAHIGVLKVLEREGIPIDYIGGTSMGGLVGGLYASGYTPDQLDIISNELPWKKLLADEKERQDLPLEEKYDYDRYILSLPVVGYVPGLPKGLKEGQLVINVLNRLTWSVNDITDFADLPTPFFCVATNLEDGDTVLIEKGDLSKALRATMSIPSIFNPIEINGESLIDGGIVNNLPVDIMLAKGVDYVIAVDVGAPLYKQDEISSVLDILDQISSFHQQNRYKTNLRLTDLYIRPNIDGLTAMSFEDVPDVIDRGEHAAMLHIDEIRRLAKKISELREYKPRVVNLKISDTVFITEMEVEGLNKLNRKLIVSRLSINLPGVNTVTKINAAIDRLYASNFFEFINYKLIRNVDGYKLEIKVKENNNSMFNVGAKYDTDQGAALSINVQLLNKLVAGSRLDLTLKVGSNPAGGIQYIVDRGQDIGFGIEAYYESNTIKTYNDDMTSIQSKYFISFTTLDLLLFSNYSNNAMFILKGSMDYMSLSSEISVVPISYHGDPYLNLSAEYVLDSYDDKYFPNKGSYVNINPVIVTQYNSKGVFYANVEMETVISLGSNLSLLPGAFLGASWGGLNNTGYVYMLGGSGRNEFKNMKSFVGLPSTGSLTNNLLVGRLHLRYQFFKKHYLSLKANASIESDLFEELFLESERITLGAGVFYSLKSLVGPIELGVSMSSQAHTPAVFFNIGFFL